MRKGIKMAPLAPNSTPRFKVHYESTSVAHTFQVRWGGSPSALSAALTGILTGLTAFYAASVVNLVEFAASGSNIFNSVTSGLEGFTWGSGPGTPGTISQYINFVGRSTGGRRVRMAVFGCINEGGDFRFSPGEAAAVDGAIAVLNDPGQPFQAIDGLKPIWKLYANAGQNAYWQKELRP
jgi:hypothetical protein